MQIKRINYFTNSGHLSKYENVAIISRRTDKDFHSFVTYVILETLEERTRCTSRSGSPMFSSEIGIDRLNPTELENLQKLLKERK